VEQIRYGVSDPGVQRVARESLRRFGAVRPGWQRLGQQTACWAAWSWPKHFVTFVQDDSLFNSPLCFRGFGCVNVPGKDELEMLVPPARLILMDRPRGDCDDFTMLVCALLGALGCSWEIVTVASDSNEPSRWSHVYAQAVLEDGSRVPLDASHGKFPGWQVPAAHVFRYQAWDSSGRKVNSPRGGDYRLHGYRRGMGALQCNWFDELGNCLGYTDQGSTVPAATAAPGFNWGGLINSGFTKGLDILQKVVAPTTTFTSKAGNLTTPGALPAGVQLPGLYQPPGGLSVAGGISFTTLAAVGLGGVLLFALLRKK